MAPKKKAAKAKGTKDKGEGKKGAKKDATGPVPPVDGPSLEELNLMITTLEKEKMKEEEYRNYMQLERDKINSFWEITKQEVADTRTALRMKDLDVEELQRSQAAQLKVYQQKVKHLMYEHQHNVTALKGDGELALKLQQDEARKHEVDLGRDKRTLKQELKEQEVSHVSIIRQLRLEHAKEVTKLRQEYELAVRELHHKADRQNKLLREDMELRRKQEVHELEERKNSHIHDLMRKHERAFAEIKNYYSDITANNLDLIKALKEDVADMKKREAQNEKLMYEVAHENKRLGEPLARALKEVESLRTQAAAGERDKASLTQCKARLAASDKQVKNLEWEVEVLQQRLGAVQAERDDLYHRFEASVYDVQQKTGLKSLLLEKKVEAISGALEMREAQLGEVLAVSQLEPSTVQQVTKRVDEVLSSKNSVIQGLKYDVAKVSKAHNDLIRVYETKLAEYGVPPEELGFRPLVTRTGKGPAGLVAGG